MLISFCDWNVPSDASLVQHSDGRCRILLLLLLLCIGTAL